MDRARYVRMTEALNLAATGSPDELMQLVAWRRAHLEDNGWNASMAPARGVAWIGVPKVAASEPAAEPPAAPAEPPAAPPEHRTMHVDVELEGGEVVGAHSVP